MDVFVCRRNSTNAYAQAVRRNGKLIQARSKAQQSSNAPNFGTELEYAKVFANGLLLLISTTFWNLRPTGLQHHQVLWHEKVSRLYYEVTRLSQNNPMFASKTRPWGMSFTSLVHAAVQTRDCCASGAAPI